MDSALGERLIGHQRTVRGIMERAKPLLREGGEPAPAPLTRLRWEMVRGLTAYQQFKHREIFDPAIGHAGQLGRMGEALKEDCVAIGDDFTRYVQRWSGRTTEEWDSYRPAALAMIDRIERHLQREERNVRSLLRAGEVSSSAPVAGRPR